MFSAERVAVTQLSFLQEIPISREEEKRIIGPYLQTLHNYGMFLKLGFSPEEVPQRFLTAKPEKVAKIQAIIRGVYQDFRANPKEGLIILSNKIWECQQGLFSSIRSETQKRASVLIDWLVNPRSLVGEPENLADEIYFEPEIYAVFPRKGKPPAVRFVMFDELILRKSRAGPRANLLNFTPYLNIGEFTVEQKCLYEFGRYAAWEIYQQFLKGQIRPQTSLRVKVPYYLPTEETKHFLTFVRLVNWKKRLIGTFAIGKLRGVSTGEQLFRYPWEK